jgi:hypothetical protein
MELKVGIKAIKNPLNWARLSPKPISKIPVLGVGTSTVVVVLS